MFEYYQKDENKSYIYIQKQISTCISESDTPKSRFDTKSFVVPALPSAPRPTFFTPSNISCFQALFISPCIKKKIYFFN